MGAPTHTVHSFFVFGLAKFVVIIQPRDTKEHPPKKKQLNQKVTRHGCSTSIQRPSTKCAFRWYAIPCNVYHHFLRTAELSPYRRQSVLESLAATLKYGLRVLLVKWYALVWAVFCRTSHIWYDTHDLRMVIVVRSSHGMNSDRAVWHVVCRLSGFGPLVR